MYVLAAVVLSLSFAGQAPTADSTQAAAGRARLPDSQPTLDAWPMFRGNPAQTGVAGDERGNPAAGALPEKLAVRWKFQLADATSSTAAIAGGSLFIGGEDGKLVALDLQTGTLQWTFAGTDPIQSSPTYVHLDASERADSGAGDAAGSVAGGAARSAAGGSASTALLIFGDNAGIEHACDAQSGAERWSFKTGSQVISSATPARLPARVATSGPAPASAASSSAPSSAPTAVAAGEGLCVVFGSYDGGLYCLRAATGELLWKYDARERIHGTPAIAPWRTTASAAADHAAAEQYVLAAACDAHLHVVRLADGALLRRFPLGSVTAAAVAVRGARVFLPAYAEQVLAADWQAGRIVWRFEDAQRPFPFMSSAAVTDDPDDNVRAAGARAANDAGLVIVGGRDKRVRALDGATGAERWQFVTKGRVDSSPVVAGERVFVGSADGNLYELDLKTGRERWRFEAGGAITASPAVASGCLVIGTESGTVYCFAAPRKAD